MNDKTCATYREYQELVEKFKEDLSYNPKNQTSDKYKPEDLYDSENDDRLSSCNNSNFSQFQGSGDLSDHSDENERKKRKRKSRWGDQSSEAQLFPPAKLTKVTRTDPALIQYAINTFGSANLSDEDWIKAEDHYKINLLYQDMLKKREEVDRLQKLGKFKYEYDSDEEQEGGTWEHKVRVQEMEATQLWANELTKKAEGKHHIGDFLPPEELRKFLEQSTAAKEGREPDLSDYKEYKLNSDNIGFQMLQKLGWSEGQGLGAESTGITDPVNK